MPRSTHGVASPAVLLLLLAGLQAQDSAAVTSRWLRESPTGLVYQADSEGDRLPDFSWVGYRSGGRALPELPVRLRLAPAPGDDTERIQAAIDEVSALAPDAQGRRGAVLLEAGRYELASSLRIRTGGVVLRGEGCDTAGTVLHATGPQQRSLIEVKGRGSPREVEGSRQRILSPLAVGDRRLVVEDGSLFGSGDSVIAFRPCTQGWIEALGMDQLPDRRDGGRVVQWSEGSRDLRFKRRVLSVAGDTLTLDAPLVNAFEAEYGPAWLYRYSFPGRLEEVGIEQLRSESAFNHASDEQHAWSFIELDAVDNAWVRDIVAVHYGYAAVEVGRQASHVTIQDSACLEPVSKLSGSRRYAFALTGQLNLVMRCESFQGRHDFVMHSTVAGPNVFLDCRAVHAHSDCGPHHRWATGTLYDNLETDGALNVRNRGNSGTGHGWAGASTVFWNCQARSIICENPPTSQNWAIGCRTEQQQGNGAWDALGLEVAPRSLYLSQLRARLGEDALAAIGYGP